MSKLFMIGSYVFKDKIGKLGNIGEVAIRGQQRETMIDAGRSDQAIDRTGLDTVSSTPLPEFHGSDIDATIERNEWKRLQDLSETIKVFFIPQPVEKFLENVACEEDSVFGTNVRTKGLNIGIPLLNSGASEHQRPHRCINHEVQRSVRSCL